MPGVMADRKLDLGGGGPGGVCRESVHFGRPSSGTYPAAGEPPGQLYDLDADPRETTNLAATQPDIVNRLKAESARIQRSSRTRP